MDLDRYDDEACCALVAARSYARAAREERITAGSLLAGCTEAPSVAALFGSLGIDGDDVRVALGWPSSDALRRAAAVLGVDGAVLDAPPAQHARPSGWTLRRRRTNPLHLALVGLDTTALDVSGRKALEVACWRTRRHRAVCALDLVAGVVSDGRERAARSLAHVAGARFSGLMEAVMASERRAG